MGEGRQGEEGGRGQEKHRRESSVNFIGGKNFLPEKYV